MIIANMATYPKRVSSLSLVIERLLPQVDILNIVLNEYQSIPLECRREKVMPIIVGDDLKDTGKFYPESSKAKYVFLVDDDILYPVDYVEKTIARYENLKYESCMASYYGSIYMRPSLYDYLRRPFLSLEFRKHLVKFRKVYHYKDKLRDEVVVDQLGSGVAILRGKDMPPYEYMKNAKRFCDVRLAKWCYEMKIIKVCLPRECGWLDDVSYDETIFRGFTKKSNCEVNKEILSYAYKNKN